MHSLAGALQGTVSRYGERGALVCGSNRWTYRAFDDRVRRLAAWLRIAELEPRHRVAVLSPNCHRLLEAYFAVPALGAILAPLNIRLHPEELAWILADCGPKLVLVDRSMAAEWAAIGRLGFRAERVLAWGEGPGGVGEDYEAALASAEPEQPRHRSRPEDPAELFYTSGTTRRPKGVVLTHGNIAAHAKALGEALPLTPEDVHLHSIALFHANGWGAPHAVTAAGAKHVILRRFDPAAVFRLIHEEHVTEMFLVPTMANLLLDAPDPGIRFPAMRRIVVGGGATFPAQVRRLEERFGAEVVASYGLTEASPVVTLATDTAGAGSDEEGRLRRRARPGSPIRGISLRVAREDGSAVASDDAEVGEVQLSGPTISPRYWNPEVRGQDSRTADGFLRTGDLATVDSHGSLRIVDRAKELIRSGSLSISSIEVEAVLGSHPEVVECAVIGVPDPRWGEEPFAYVVLRDGSRSTAKELAAHCRAHLARFKVPRGFSFVASLPKSGTGKILKRELLRPPPGSAIVAPADQPV